MEKVIYLEPIEKPSTLHQRAYNAIKAYLTSGKMDLDTIYSANQFAEILGVSRTPVRDALIQLSAEGFLISVEKQGFKIKDFSKKEIIDFYETRRIIETYVIEHLTENIKKGDLQNLSRTLELMKDYERKGDMQGFIEADRDFHMILIYRYDNHLLSSIMENIRSSIALFGKRALSREGRPLEVIKEHAEIFEGLSQKSPKKAVKALGYHLDVTQKYLI